MTKNNCLQYMNKMDKVINGPDPEAPPSDDPMDQSVITRYRPVNLLCNMFNY